MKVFFLLYGIVSYLIFFATFLYAIGFVGGIAVPKGINDGGTTSLTAALLVNLGLMSLFALQHSIMARQGFKKWWTTIIPEPIERSTYVLLTSLCLILLFWQWRPLTDVIWDMTLTSWEIPLQVLFGLGWLIVLVSTFLINHFELFGLQQVYQHFKNLEPKAPTFKSPLFYKLVRHPIYVGFILAFWSTPLMTMGQLLFAAVTTAYILVAIRFEEKDLVASLGEDYVQYKKRVSMIIPMPPKK